MKNHNLLVLVLVLFLGNATQFEIFDKGPELIDSATLLKLRLTFPVADSRGPRTCTEKNENRTNVSQRELATTASVQATLSSKRAAEKM